MSDLSIPGTHVEIDELWPGIIHCPYESAAIWMPELEHVFKSAPLPHNNYTVDVKVHMLMPGMWPCIPNWHRDMVPRDENKKLQEHLIDPTQKMYLWVSGAPLTEFKETGLIEPRTWVEFTQNDWHRGTMSTEFTWRLFIRMVPSVLLPPRGNSVIRKHSQVYLDSNNFEW